MLDPIYIALTTICIALAIAKQLTKHGMVVSPQVANTISEAYDVLSIVLRIVSLVKYFVD